MVAEVAVAPVLPAVAAFRRPSAPLLLAFVSQSLLDMLRCSTGTTSARVTAAATVAQAGESKPAEAVVVSLSLS